MDIENHSPFPHMVFEKAGKQHQLFDVIVVAGTFDLRHGQPLLIADEQKPINGVDRYEGEPESSGFLEETQLVLTKQRTDIQLIGSAKPSNGSSAAHWPMALRVGPVSKTAMLHGPRLWSWSLMRGWHLTPAQPAAGVALHLGMSYGGVIARAGYRGPATSDIHDEQAFDTFADNPAGKGYVGSQSLDRAQFYPAAQIEDVEHPIRDIHKRYKPVAFGPVPRWTPARARHIGDCDAKWQAEQFPFLPDDFNFAFYQSAQPDLIAPGWLQGDEPIVLLGCHPSGRLDSYLPGLRLLALLTDDGGHVQAEPLRLDTLSIDLDNDTVQLVWRRSIAKSWGLRHVMLAAIPDGPAQASVIRPVHIHRQPMARPTGAGHG